MSIKISTENKTESERMVLLLNIAVATALRENILNIEEAENLLFSPYSINKLQGFDQEILDIIKLGCELEDVESLVPENLSESINEIFNLSISKLKQLEKVDIPAKKWID